MDYNSHDTHREESLNFRLVETADEMVIEKSRSYKYPNIEKKLGNFNLSVAAGEFSDSEIVVLVVSYPCFSVCLSREISLRELLCLKT